MGMTIEEHIAQLVKVKHYASPRHYETLDMAIETMRKYQQIEQIIEVWHQDIYAKDFECIAEVAEVVEDGNDD